MARVLLVDDELDNRNMLHDALTLKGHDVVVAGDSREAMALPPRPPFDVAIIDYVLPGMRGLDLLHQLRKKYPSLRSIIISGQLDHAVLTSSVVEKQLQEKILADRYLPKPFSTEALVQAIEEVTTGTTGGKIAGKRVTSGGVPSQGVRVKDVKKVNKILKKGRKKKR